MTLEQLRVTHENLKQLEIEQEGHCTKLTMEGIRDVIWLLDGLRCVAATEEKLRLAKQT